MALAKTGFVLTCCLAISGCEAIPETTPPEYRVGLLVTLTGPRAKSSGRATVQGAELAAREINERGGIEIGGQQHRVTLVIKDYPKRPDAAASMARSLINQDSVDAIVGPQVSDHAIPVARIAENARIPMISPMSTNPETTAGHDFAFRVAFLDDFQGQVIARIAAQELSAQRAAVLFDVSSAYSRGLASVFMNAFEGGGGDVVASETYTGDAEDFSGALTRIAATRPDVLFLPNYSWATTTQIRQAREAGVDATLLGGDTWDLEDLSSMKASDGAFATHQWNPSLPTSEAKAFREAYRLAYEGEPRATAALTFDAIMLLGNAVHSAQSRESEAVRNALANTGGHQGASGLITYRGTGDPIRSAVVSIISDGRPSIFKVVEP